MEADLASLADVVVVIVESPGTIAELGAFSNSDALRPKILPIVDKDYEGEPSFICNGPLQWIDRESIFSPTIYVPLETILLAVSDIEERISRIPKAKPTAISDLAESPKHLLFFLCDLVGVIYPATIEMVEEYVSLIAPSILNGDISIPTLLGLAVSVDLLQIRDVMLNGKNFRFLWPTKLDAIEHPFHHKLLLDLPSQRASHLSVLLTIPEATAALNRIGRPTP